MIEIEQNDEKDQVEVGSAPLKTKDGWLVFYSYIYNYFSPPAIFGVQAVLLYLDDPKKIVGEVKRPFLVPEEEYEYYGRVPHIVFPSGALHPKKRKRKKFIFITARRTRSLASRCCHCDDLLEQLVFTTQRQLVRFEENPIIAPVAEHKWESKATFNPAAILLNGKVRILYRAMSDDNTSVMGYASSVDGVHISKRVRGAGLHAARGF